MEFTYEEFENNLKKLQRNETQMSSAQKIQYARQLKALKNKIAKQATEITREFVCSGIRILKDDPKGDEAMKAIQGIVEREVEAGVLKEVSRILFKTYDTDKFLNALVPFHEKVWYEGYGPYWAAHCSRTENAEYPYWNDIIEMWWWEKGNIWQSGGDEVVFTIMLPPTMELIKERYEEEKKQNARIL